MELHEALVEIERLNGNIECLRKAVRDLQLNNDKLFQFIQKQQRELIELTYEPEKY